MHVSMEESGEMTALLTIKVEEEDYREEVEKSLREQRRTLSLPGFRPGKVPASVVNRMVGKTILSKTVVNLAYDALSNHIKDHELRILGQPLPIVDGETELDWDNGREFVFRFDLGLAPVIEPFLEQLSPLPYYKIRVEDAQVDESIMGYQKELGSLAEKDSIQDETDLISARFVELDESGQEISGAMTYQSKFTLRQIKDNDTKGLLMGLEEGNISTINPARATAAIDKVAYLIGANPEDDFNAAADYKITIDKVEAIEPHPLGDAFYAKVIPGRVFSSEEEFREAVREIISNAYDADAERFFYHQAKTELLKELQVPMPASFLKRWLQEQQENADSKADIEAEFDSFINSMRWQLIKDAIQDKYAINVTRDDIHDYFVNDMKRRINLPEDFQDESLKARLSETANQFIEEGKFVDEVEKELVQGRLQKLFSQEVPKMEKEVTLKELEDIIKNSNLNQE